MLDDDDDNNTPTPLDAPSAALVPLSPFDPAWRPILHVSNQVVLYNPTSHALTIHSSHPHARARARAPARPRRRPRVCPYCARPLPPGFARAREDGREYGINMDMDMDLDLDMDLDGSDMDMDMDMDVGYDVDAFEDEVSRAPNYFQLLEVANETASRPGTPPPYRVGAARAPSSSTSGSLSGSLSSAPRSLLDEDADADGEREGRRSGGWGAGGGLRPGSMAEGYFNAFFKEEARLGMGANGSVYLCQHVLDGNPLGHFAVKKIAVGESSAYLLQILREVRLLETLRHPNVVSYHHAWLESTRFSQFGPTVPTLHVLMQWAEGGSLDDLIDTRLGRPTHLPAFPPSSPSSPSRTSPSSPSSPSPTSPDHQSPADKHQGHQGHQHQHSRSARIRAFRALQRAPPEDKARLREKLGLGAGSPGVGAGAGAGAGAGGGGGGGGGTWKAVHLFSAEEVRGLFADVVEGLAFLHDKSILHLDLKPGNVLLTWDEGKLIPRAMLSDFGTSRDMIHSTRARSGNTGTLEYTAPESLPSPLTGRLQQVDSKADMWSLGMLLHKLLFFRLPYRWAAQGDRDETAAPGPVTPEANRRDGVGASVGAGAGAGGGAGGESDMDRLEREVLGYKGFKSTPELETTFAARRLPGSYPILLESLLNVAPGARPSCERVLAALHDGKLDPIPATRGRPKTTAVTASTAAAALTSLIPAPRRLPSSGVSSPATTPTASDYAGGSVRGPKWEREWEHEREQEAAMGAGRRALPAPDVPDARVWWAWVGELLGYGRGRGQGQGQRQRGRGRGRMATVAVRAMKSCALVVKVASLAYVRPDAATGGGTAVATVIVVGFLLVLGVADTLFEGVDVSVALGLVHLLVLWACGATGPELGVGLLKSVVWGRAEEAVVLT